MCLYAYRCGKTVSFKINLSRLIHFSASSPVFTFWYLCSVPTAEAPGDAMSECSGGIQGEGPTLHHMTTREKNIQYKITMINVNNHRI